MLSHFTFSIPFNDKKNVYERKERECYLLMTDDYTVRSNVRGICIITVRLLQYILTCTFEYYISRISIEINRKFGTKRSVLIMQRDSLIHV